MSCAATSQPIENAIKNRTFHLSNFMAADDRAPPLAPAATAVILAQFAWNGLAAT